MSRPDPIIAALSAGIPCRVIEMPMPERPGFTWCGVCAEPFADADSDAHYALDGPHIAISGRWTDEQRAREMAAPIERALARQRKTRGGQEDLFS